MKTTDILEKFKTFLEEGKQEEASNYLSELYSEEDLQWKLWEIDDILQEITLWVEFSDDEYKNEALDLINNF